MRRARAWRYVNVRRLFTIFTESVDDGAEWVVSEPNYEPLLGDDDPG
jgi:phage tail sheath protein FI